MCFTPGLSSCVCVVCLCNVLVSAGCTETNVLSPHRAHTCVMATESLSNSRPPSERLVHTHYMFLPEIFLRAHPSTNHSSNLKRLHLHLIHHMAASHFFECKSAGPNRAKKDHKWPTKGPTRPLCEGTFAVLGGVSDRNLGKTCMP